jgi:hypothetical protein
VIRITPQRWGRLAAVRRNARFSDQYTHKLGLDLDAHRRCLDVNLVCGLLRFEWGDGNRLMLRYAPALLMAAAWTLAWGLYRRVWLRMWGAFLWGRHDSPAPTVCWECGWAGPLRRAVHTYAACDVDDVEPVDECPQCGKEI